MASKQLGKLRQWAGEVISSRDKTTLSEEFQELEKDIELRREGAAKLLAASEAYQHALSKKKKNEAFEDAEKLLPIDMLGIVMIVHGEEFGDDSAFGTSLVKLGRAHCKVATLQEAYALTLNDTFLASLTKFTDDIKEYDAQRKKLDSRRLSYDAAVAKFEKLKNGKKEKEKREAEEEMEKARQRYDETLDDVQSQMHDIQEKEIVQLHGLTSFLDLEIGFVEQYLSVLKDVKESWYEESSLMRVPPRRSAAPAHVLPRPNSVQSRVSNRSNVRDPSDSDEESVSRPPRSRRLSKRSDSISSKPPSRPSSRSSRKRANSAATIGEKDDKDKDRITKRLSVAGWASSAVESVTGRSKKNKDKDKFSTLNDDDPPEREADEEGRRSPGKKSSSFHSLSRKLSRDKSKEASPKLAAKILKPPSLQERKIVRARHSFAGSADELSFSTGEEIVVINEVLDGWWMGELNGKRGLFPTTYVEAVTLKPALPRRLKGPSSNPATSSFSPDGARHGALDDGDSESYMSTDLDDDHDLEKQPLSAHQASPFFSGPPDAASIASSLAEEEDDKLLVPFSRNADFDSTFEVGDEYFRSAPVSRTSSVPSERKILHSLNTSPQPPFPRRATTTETKSPVTTTPTKKAPPPPPPRRSTTTLGPTPPIPERSYKHQPSGQQNAPTPASSISSHGYDQSPFESATELSTPGTSDGTCTNFKQNPFQAKGMCNNCFRFHG